MNINENDSIDKTTSWHMAYCYTCDENLGIRESKAKARALARAHANLPENKDHKVDVIPHQES